MIRASVALVSVAIFLLSAGMGWAQSYSGSLSWANDPLTSGLVARDGWQVPGASITWDVSREGAYDWWTYAYTLYIPSDKSVSHFILETSGALTLSDIRNVQVGDATGWFDSYRALMGTYQQGTDNPYLPASLYGIKLEDPTANNPEDNPYDWPTGDTLRITFESCRNPVWSDFYAKDGQGDGEWAAIWNEGFTDPNPSDPPTSGTINNHILAPDTEIAQPPAPHTPELPPGALLLLTLVPAAWAGVRRKSS